MHSLFELITDRLYRANRLGEDRDFLTQMSDVNVNGSARPKVAITPDMIENHVAGQQPQSPQA